MKRGQQTFDSRPEAARRRKPCSKIEAKLRLRRRGKLEKKCEEEKSPRIRGRKLDCDRSLAASSSDNESPRFFTSKQHVELVDFELRKFAGNSATPSEKLAKSCEEKLDGRGTRKSLGKCHENPRKNSGVPIDRSVRQESSNSWNKKRSRSAPCTPLFRIKCAKERCPRNWLAERKSLMEKSLREEIRRLRKNRPIGLRISRSGEVAVGSCEISSEERIVERASLEAFESLQEKSVSIKENPEFNENNEKQPINFAEAAKNSQEQMGREETNSQENLREEIIFTLEERTKNDLIHENQNVEENEEKRTMNHENCEDVEATNAEKKNSPEETIFTEDNLEEKKISAGEENPSKNENFNINSEILDIKTNGKVEDRKNSFVVLGSLQDRKKEKSPRKPPKKRAFKWETILEKQHRQFAARSPENRKASPEICGERGEEEKLNFWSDKAADCSNHCRCPRPREKSLENRKLEAYNLIREELPKILMKRRNALLAQRIQDSKLNRSNKSSPERAKEILRGHDSRFNSRFNSRFCENLPRHYKHQKNSPREFFEGSKNLFVSKKIENSRPKDPRDFSEKSVEVPRVDPRLTIVDLPENSEQSGGNNKCKKEMPRASILKRRKTPSPRRVTFRLPGRVMEEIFPVDDSRDVDNFDENEVDDFYNRETNFSKMPEEHFDERKVNVGNEERTLSREKRRRPRTENLPNGAVGPKIVQHFRWISPRLLASTDDQNCCQSDHSEQDWETPCGEDIYRASKAVSFPKETREAMKILLRARGNHQCQRRINEGQIFHPRNSLSSPERNSTLRVSKSYAKALAKFQEGCDLEVQENVFGSSRLRGSRMANEAGGK